MSRDSHRENPYKRIAIPLQILFEKRILDFHALLIMEKAKNWIGVPLALQRMDWKSGTLVPGAQSRRRLYLSRDPLFGTDGKSDPLVSTGITRGSLSWLVATRDASWYSGVGFSIRPSLGPEIDTIHTQTRKVERRGNFARISIRSNWVDLIKPLTKLVTKQQSPFFRNCFRSWVFRTFGKWSKRTGLKL